MFLTGRCEQRSHSSCQCSDRSEDSQSRALMFFRSEIGGQRCETGHDHCRGDGIHEESGVKLQAGKSRPNHEEGGDNERNALQKE